MENLPEELITHIFSFLTLPSLNKCRQVCKSWSNTIRNQRHWLDLTLKQMVVSKRLFFAYNENWEPLFDYFTSNEVTSQDEKFFWTIMNSYFGHVGPRHHPERTPFHVACSNGRLDIVEFLLPTLKKLSIEIKSFRDYSPTQYAVTSGNLDLIKHLLGEFGLLASQIDSYVELAIQYEHLGVIKYFMQFHDFQFNHGSFLLLASKAKSLELLKFIFEKSSEKCPKDEETGSTPLHLAVASGRIQNVEFFMEQYQMVDFIDHFHSMPLHIAALNGDVKVFAMLYKETNDHFSHLNCMDENILNLAIKSRNFLLVKHLVKEYKSLDKTLEDMPKHPLLTAALPFVANMKIFEFIYEQSEEKCPVNEYGESPLHLAVLGQCKSLIRFLQEAYKHTSISINK